MVDFNNVKLNTTKDIKVLGTGCAKCKSLEKLTLELVDELQLDAKVSKVEDIVDIMKYGVMSTPALVLDEKVLFSGKLPSKKELTELLTK